MFQVNEEEDNGSILDGLIENPQEIIVMDQMFAKAFRHFQIITIFSLIFSVMKVIAAPFVLRYSEFNDEKMRVWFICLLCISFLQGLYYIATRIISLKRRIFVAMGEKLRHAEYFRIQEVTPDVVRTQIHWQIYNYESENQEENERELRMLALQVKFNVLNYFLWMKVVSKVLFVLYQTLHIWGFVIYFTQQEETLASDFMIIILFMGTYQYFEFYSLIIVVCVAAPFIGIYLAVSRYLRKRKQEAIARSLEGVEYRKSKVKGDHTCSICMDTYKKGDIISTLECNQLHHFHQSCLAEWIKISNSCPMCRQSVSS